MKPTELVGWLRSYADDRLSSMTIDERRCLPPYVVLDFGNRGILGMLASQSYGGLGYGHSEACAVLEQLGAIDTTICLFVGLNNYLGLRPIAHFAQQETKDDLLPRLATGRELAAFALTEPSAGSNTRAIEARADPDGPDQWILHGTKQWIGSAQWAGVINVFAREGNTRAVGGHVLRQGTPGLRLGSESPTMGMRGMIQNTIFLEGARTHRRDRLGREGEGMSVAQDAMTYARLGIAAMCCGAIQRCAQLALRYTSRRRISTGLLLDNPRALGKLGRMTAAATAIKCLFVRLARAADLGEPVAMEAFVACKIAAPEFLWHAVDDLMQLLGGRGYMENTPVPQLMRDARVLRIFEGPTETMEAFLGARLMASSSGLTNLIGKTLGAEHLTQQLDRLAEAIQESSEKLTEPLARGSVHWGQAHGGRLATWLILQAAVEGPKGETLSAEQRRVAAWLEASLAHELRLLRHRSPEDTAYLDSDAVRQVIASFHDSIGDTDQTLPSMDSSLDPLLRRERATGTTHAEPSLRGPGDASAGVGQRKTNTVLVEDAVERTAAEMSELALITEPGEVKAWLVNWLSIRLRLPASEIHTSRSFADHGLDSLLGLELTRELGNLLGLSLSETLLWEVATIDALASAIAAFQRHPEMGASGVLPTLGKDEELQPPARLETELDMLEAELAFRRR